MRSVSKSWTATRQHLVHIGLVPGVEDDRIVRRVEHPMQSKGELDHTEVGAEVPAGCSDLVNQEFADFLRQVAHLRLGQVLQICGAADLFKHPASLRNGLGSVLPSVVDVGHTIMISVGGLDLVDAPIRRVAAQQHRRCQYTCDNGADEHADLDVVAGRGAVPERQFTD